EHLPEVAPGRRVLEGMRGVGVEESAAVRAELLDRLLARHGSHGEDLLHALDRGDRDIVREVLDHTLLDEEQRDQRRNRQEEIEGSADEVDPEIAETSRGVPGD